MRRQVMIPSLRQVVGRRCQDHASITAIAPTRARASESRLCACRCRALLRHHEFAHISPRDARAAHQSRALVATSASVLRKAENQRLPPRVHAPTMQRLPSCARAAKRCFSRCVESKSESERQQSVTPSWRACSVRGLAPHAQTARSPSVGRDTMSARHAPVLHISNRLRCHVLRANVPACYRAPDIPQHIH